MATTARPSTPPASSELALGGLLISSERISYEASGDQVTTAVRRDAVSKVWVYNDVNSEHPFREFFWGIGLAAIGTWQATIREGIGERIGAAALVVIAGWMLLRLLKRRTELTCFGNKGGQMTFAMSRKLARADLQALRVRMRDEFGWPVQD